eukprot:1175248-Ditylum_brightwellii.AAC.1
MPDIEEQSMIKNFDLHVHKVCHLHQHTAMAIATTVGKDAVRDTRSKLYKMNNQSAGWMVASKINMLHI